MKRLLTILFFCVSASGLLAENDFNVADLTRILAKNPEWKNFAKKIPFIKYDRSQGSGIFVSPVHVITANHVTESMDCGSDMKIRTRMRAGDKPKITGGRSLVCDEMIIQDKELDISMFTVDRSVIDYFKINPKIAEKIKVSSAARAIGYTTSAHFGFSRDCLLNDFQGPKVKGGQNTKSFEDFLVTDCMISPGMSGGPFMVQVNGIWELAGLNSAVLTEEAGDHAFKVMITNLSLAMSKYKDEFQEVFDEYEE